ncbi:DMT family transporter [Bacillus tianshenii]|nr:DMT family transporter [Bacillus tianshenii]
MEQHIQNKISITNTHKLGVLFLITSALLTGANQVYYAKKVQQVEPLHFTFFSFFLCMITFQAINLRSKKRVSLLHKDLVYLNLSTALAFMSFYTALKYIEPAIVSALEMGLGPLFTLIFSIWLYPSKRSSIQEYILSTVTLIGSLFLYWTTISGHSGLGHLPFEDITKGIAAAVCCGAGAVLAAIYSKRLSNSGWNATKIMAHRFYAIVVLSGIWGITTLPTSILNNFQWMLLVSIAGVIIPLYLLQLGIQYCEPLVVIMSICFVPVFTFFFQLFDVRLELSLSTLLGILVLTSTAGFSMVKK